MFKYETHCHTKEGSKCGREPAEATVDFYKDMGFDGIFITDHFLNGHTAVNRKQAWQAQIEEFCHSYELAKARGDEVGLQVFFGWEYTYRYIGKGGKRCAGSDFLTYGLDKDWLLAHPEIMELELSEYCDFVRSEGGFIIHAHPFREDYYIDMIRLIPRSVDGVEVLNTTNSDDQNKMAEIYADHYGLLKTAGSDTHYFERDRFSGIYTKNKITCASDMISELKCGTAEIFVEKK